MYPANLPPALRPIHRQLTAYTLLRSRVYLPPSAVAQALKLHSQYWTKALQASELADYCKWIATYTWYPKSGNQQVTDILYELRSLAPQLQTHELLPAIHASIWHADKILQARLTPPPVITISTVTTTTETETDIPQAR